MKGFLGILILLVFFNASYSQDLNTDSIMKARKTEHLKGKIPTSYTVGYESRAKVLKNAFESAAIFYEKKYHKKFKLRLAVLDSNQWPVKELPFGFMDYDSGWAVIPAKIPYQFFLRLYGIETRQVGFEAFLKKNGLTPNEIISSVYLVYALHELGHYFIEDLEHEQVPDMFANEMIATYFSFNYFKSIHSRDLNNLILFSKFITQNYNGKYHKIEAMDSLYTNMPIQNFKWYHCNIVLLCSNIYNKKAGSFMDEYLALFTKGAKSKYTTSDVVTLVDKHSGSVVKPWVNNLERYRPPAD